MTQTSSNPFVGPNPLRANDELFGRDVELKNLSNLLIAERIVLLYSPSGAGKTSLISARDGLIARLRDTAEFRVLPVIRVNLAPAVLGGGGTNRYVRSVLESLEEGVPPAQRRSVAELGSLRLKTYLDGRPRLAVDGPVASELEVLIFDQFEEVITLDPIDHDAKVDCFRQIGESLRDRHRWALFVMREDHLAEVDEYSHLIPTALATRFRLNLLTRGQAKTAIKGPTAAQPFGDDVIGELVDDLARVTVREGEAEGQAVGEHVEPVQLQVVCHRLWERHLRKKIEVDDLTGSVAVNEALEQFYADVVAKAVNETGVLERSVRDWIDGLIVAGSLRGQVMREQGMTRGLDNKAIDVLKRELLLRSDRHGGREWIEITHDRLVRPIRQSNERWRRAHLVLLQQQAALWHEHLGAEGLLLTGTALDEAEAWAKDHAEELAKSEVDREFLAACRAARERDRQIAEQNRQIAEQNQQLALSNREIDKQNRELGKKNQEIEAQRRRAQSLSIYALIFAGLASVLAVVSFVWYLEINKNYETIKSQETKLQKKETLAQIRQLLAASRTLPGAQYRKSLALALYANERLTPALVSEPGDAELQRELSATRFALVSGLLAAPPSEKQLVGHHLSVRRVAFSPSGTWLASGSFDKSVILWNLRTGGQTELTGHEDGVYSVAFSPDGALLASADAGGRIRLWRVSDTGAESVGPKNLNDLKGGHDKGKRVVALAFSPDGRSLASAGWDKQVILWDLADPNHPRVAAKSRPRSAPEGSHQSPVYALTFISRTSVAAGDWDGKILLWNWTPSEPSDADIVPLIAAPVPRVMLNSDESAAVFGIAYSVPGDRLAASIWIENKNTKEGSSRIAVWEKITSPEPQVKLLDYPGRQGVRIYGLAFSPDGQVLASAEGESSRLVLYPIGSDDRRGKTEVRFQERIYSVAFASTNPRTLAVGGARTVMLLDTRHLGSMLTQVLNIQLDDADFDTVWDQVAVSADARLIAASADKRLVTWTAIGEPVTGFTKRGSIDDVKAKALATLVVNRNGSLIATSGLDGGPVRIWSAAGDLVAKIDVMSKSSRGCKLAFSPTEDLLAVASDKVLGLYDLTDAGRPALLGSLQDARGSVRALAFQVTGKQLATSDTNSDITLWNVTRAQGLLMLREMEGFRLPGEPAASLAYGADSRSLAAGSLDSDIWVFDLQRHTETVVLDDHPVAVRSLAIGHRGHDTVMLSADVGGRVYLWEDYSGLFRRLGRPLVQGTGRQVPVGMSATGDIVVTGGQPLYVWDLRFDSLLRLACKQPSNPLSDVEKDAYGVSGSGDPCATHLKR